MITIDGTPAHQVVEHAHKKGWCSFPVSHLSAIEAREIKASLMLPLVPCARCGRKFRQDSTKWMQDACAFASDGKHEPMPRL